MMRKIQTMLFILIAVGAFSAVAASGASGHEWLLDGKPILTKTLIHGTWKMSPKDSKGGLFGEAVELVCEGTSHGFVGPGALVELDEITATSCKTITGFCLTPLIKMVHMPWMDELITSGSELRDLVGPGTGGDVGWAIECSGEVEDTCEGMTTTDVDNLSADVDLLFDFNSEKFNCTRGGAGAEFIKGGWLLLQTGHSLRAD